MARALSDISFPAWSRESRRIFRQDDLSAFATPAGCRALCTATRNLPMSAGTGTWSCSAFWWPHPFSGIADG